MSPAVLLAVELSLSSSAFAPPTAPSLSPEATLLSPASADSSATAGPALDWAELSASSDAFEADDVSTWAAFVVDPSSVWFAFELWLVLSGFCC